jgi:hypothetical protein
MASFPQASPPKPTTIIIIIIILYILFSTAAAFPFVLERQRNLFKESIGFIICGC